MSCPAPPEHSFHCLDSAEHLRGLEIAFDQRDGVGEIPSSPADSNVENDRRSIEEPKFLIECRNCCLDDPWRSSVTAMRAVRADADGVEVRHQKTLSFRAA